MSINEWVRLARAHKGWNQQQLGDAVGRTKANIGHWETGKHAPSLQQVEAISLATGYPMPTMGADPAAFKPSDAIKVALGQSSATSGISNVAPAAVGSRPIPLITSIQAGELSEVVDPFQPGDAHDWLYTDLPVSDGTFALEIEGYSMSPEFMPGDRVIIDPAVQPHPGDYVAAQNGSREATFKKYRPRGVDEFGNTVFELTPLNEDYPTLRSDITPLRVIGTMIEHRKYRRKR